MNADAKSPNIRQYSLESLQATLIEVFGEEYCANPHRKEKVKTLYKLAKEASKELGLIVELGAKDGFGAICLCYGAKDGNGAIVHTVDSYQEITGFLGEHYGPENMEKFHHNTERAGVTPVLHVDGFVELGSSCDPLLGWDYPVSLLIWDGGGGNIRNEFLAWQFHVSIGGLMVGKDTANCAFGIDEIFNEYLADGRWGFRKQYPAYYRSIQRIAF